MSSSVNVLVQPETKIGMGKQVAVLVTGWKFLDPSCVTTPAG